MATGATRAAFHRDYLTAYMSPWRGPEGDVVVRIAVAAADHTPVQTQLTQPLRRSRSPLQQWHRLVPTVAVGA